MTSNKEYSLDDLSVLTDLSKRTIRYYIQMALVERPIGEKRAARYNQQHLERLLTIRKWTNSGVSLERIKELLNDDNAAPPIPPKRVGAIELRSHLLLAPGIEVVVEPGQASFSAEQLRAFLRGSIELYNKIIEEDENDHSGNHTASS